MAAAAVSILNVEPGSYTSLSVVMRISSLSVPTSSRGGSAGSYVGYIAMASTAPVFTSITMACTCCASFTCAHSRTARSTADCTSRSIVSRSVLPACAGT